jgi:hypothetical protein
MMDSPELVDVSQYAQKYNLKQSVLELNPVPPTIDLNQSGLLMHGSEADPYMILKYGLAPNKSEDNMLDGEWQVCLGLNSLNPDYTLEKDRSRKNSAVKYAGYFSPKGMVYVLSDEVKLLPNYSEYWDEGEDSRGYAWVRQPIPTHLIEAVVTNNLPLAAAVLMAAESDKCLFKPKGTCYRVKQL